MANNTTGVQGKESLGSWFLGPKLENLDILQKLCESAFSEAANFRQCRHAEDLECITSETKRSETYSYYIEQLQKELAVVCKDLKKSHNFASTRNGLPQGDRTLPGVVGYLAALLYTPNNIISSHSPAVTPMEIEVGEQLCEMLGYDLKSHPKPWGHVTSCGSISNIEAFWAAQNLKFYPLAVQKAMKECPEIADIMFETKVNFPEKTSYQNIQDMSTWNAANLDVDSIVNMASSIRSDKYIKLIEKHKVSYLGWNRFLKTHGLNEPVIIGSAACHYSLPKAASLLGLGRDNILRIKTDRNARIDMQELDKVLHDCLQRQIPIITVMANHGSTEFGAIDPLEEIVNLRNKYMEKGLYFSIHADAAFGGYFASMLREDGENLPNKLRSDDYCAHSLLSDYAKKQYSFLKQADTITVDPQKCGFTPLPTSVICYRNGLMKHFNMLKTSYTDSGNDESTGMFTLEGSRQSAAAVGALMTHKVIGLHKYGYGRILEHCLLGAKIMFCKWLTLAKEDDNFVCFPVKPLPTGIALESVKLFIKKYIEGKSAEKIRKNKTAMEFLKQIGPDLVKNPFVVNFKTRNTINDDVGLCNKLNSEIFHRMTFTNKTEHNNRVPLTVFHTVIDKDSYPVMLDILKENLGLKGSGGLEASIHIVLSPWLVYNNNTDMFASTFRQIVLDSIGKITDEPVLHSFMAAGNMTGNTVFCDYITNLQIPSHQYQAIVKMKFLEESDAEEYMQRKEKCAESKVIIQIESPEVLGKLLDNSKDVPFMVSCYFDVPSAQNRPFLSNVLVLVDDIPLYKHVDMTVEPSNGRQEYFLYGDESRTQMSRKTSKISDCLQVAVLEQKPNRIPLHLIEQGIDVSFFLSDKTKQKNGSVKKPEHIIQYQKIDGTLDTSTVHLNQNIRLQI
ncbi:L-tyrosine decarboxylase-like [Mytilus edulis]|uniref:L-tyrosine decarboxylase-like n=1 Tax=Mytilus edulis TaxID=6550 RepID=UPI0039EED61B